MEVNMNRENKIVYRFLLTSEQQANVHLTSGQICYEAAAVGEPTGKHIALAKKVSTQRIDLACKFHISNYFETH